jgi:FkbM family methyltransferase
MTRKTWLTLAFIATTMAALVSLFVNRTTEIRVTSEPLKSEHGKQLEAAYGPNRYSMGPEEWIIREVLRDQRDGVFVDVGAADARILSNTYYLESVLGWSGLAVDAQATYAPDYARYRPRTKFRSFFISDVSGRQLPLYIPEQKESASSIKGWGGTPTKTIEVATITLDDLLERERLTRVDLLSMDIEEHEPQALAGFSIDRYRPKLVVIEAHPPIRQELVDYFTRHRYVLLAKYLPVDDYNFYFVPLPQAARPAS